MFLTKIASSTKLAFEGSVIPRKINIGEKLLLWK